MLRMYASLKGAKPLDVVFYIPSNSKRVQKIATKRFGAKEKDLMYNGGLEVTTKARAKTRAANKGTKGYCNRP